MGNVHNSTAQHVLAFFGMRCDSPRVEFLSNFPFFLPSPDCIADVGIQASHPSLMGYTIGEISCPPQSLIFSDCLTLDVWAVLDRVVCVCIDERKPTSPPKYTKRLFSRPIAPTSPSYSMISTSPKRERTSKLAMFVCLDSPPPLLRPRDMDDGRELSDGDDQTTAATTTPRLLISLRQQKARRCIRQDKARAHAQFVC